MSKELVLPLTCKQLRIIFYPIPLILFLTALYIGDFKSAFFVISAAILFTQALILGIWYGISFLEEYNVRCKCDG